MIPDFRDGMSYGEMLGPAMEITDPVEAQEYFAAYVGWLAGKWGKSREEAAETARANLGYFAGYYDAATQERVARLFGALHPIFGAERPTPEEAVEAGKRLVTP